MNVKKIHNWLKKHPRLYWRARLKFFKWPRLYYFIVYLTKWKRLLVNNDTTITIEGFPRSANTFCRRAFWMAEADKLKVSDFEDPKEFGKKYGYKIATHLHASPQVIRSIHLGKPTLVLIRNPKDAIVSMKSREIQKGTNPEIAHYSIKPMLEYYIQFYRAVMPYKENVVVGRFEEITKDFNKIIKRINKKFNTNFGRFRYTKRNMEIVKGKWNHIFPDKERERIKNVVVREIERHKDLLEKANKVYREFKQ